MRLSSKALSLRQAPRHPRVLRVGNAKLSEGLSIALSDVLPRALGPRIPVSRPALNQPHLRFSYCGSRHRLCAETSPPATIGERAERTSSRAGHTGQHFAKVAGRMDDRIDRHAEGRHVLAFCHRRSSSRFFCQYSILADLEDAIRRGEEESENYGPIATGTAKVEGSSVHLFGEPRWRY